MCLLALEFPASSHVVYLSGFVSTGLVDTFRIWHSRQRCMIIFVTKEFGFNEETSEMF
jgi:hypothetical protein